MASAVREFMGTYPAIRLQHRPDYPVGKGLEAWQDAEGATHLKALIVDEQCKRMVRKQVLRAFSVGLSGPSDPEVCAGAALGNRRRAPD